MDSTFYFKMAAWKAEMDTLMLELQAVPLQEPDAVDVLADAIETLEGERRRYDGDWEPGGLPGTPFWDVDSDPNQQSPGWNREPTAELVTSRSGRIVTANDRTEALLRCPARHIVGKPILVFIASEERRGFVHSYARLRRRDSHATAEWLVNIKPCFDEAVPVVLRARPLRSADGELLQVAMSLFTHGNRVRDRLADSSLLR